MCLSEANSRSELQLDCVQTSADVRGVNSQSTRDYSGSKGETGSERHEATAKWRERARDLILPTMQKIDFGLKINCSGVIGTCFRTLSAPFSWQVLYIKETITVNSFIFTVEQMTPCLLQRLLVVTIIVSTWLGCFLQLHTVYRVSFSSLFPQIFAVSVHSHQSHQHFGFRM